MNQGLQQLEALSRHPSLKVSPEQRTAIVGISCPTIVLALILQNAIIVAMNSKHRKTLEIVFSDPISGNLPWDRIEALLVVIGCNVVEGSGSSVTFEKDGRRAYFHRPHPQREALIYRVKAAREFLMKLEITP